MLRTRAVRPDASHTTYTIHEGGKKVVVEAVADVGDLVGGVAADGDEFAEKRGIGFGEAPVLGGGENIAGEIQLSQESASSVV